MRIEDEVFARFAVSEAKLKEYGFQPQGDELVFFQYLPYADFQITIVYHNGFHGKIIDLETDEEYVNYRLENASGFSAEIKDAFTGLLTDIRDRCCSDRHFMLQQAQRVDAFIQQAFNGKPEFLWKNLPTYAVYRKQSSQKWYALIGTVPRNKVNKSANSEETVEILNLKTTRAAELHKQSGIYPAYHMNKRYWVSIILDDSVTDADIQQLIGESYQNV